MRVGTVIVIVVVSAAFFIQLSADDKKVFTREDTLSAYHFFKGALADLQPAEGIIPYDLNTPLFSNYATKLRFVKLPKGTVAVYNDSDVFEFPVGTIFIKNFYYPLDFRKPEKGRVILETRLLVHEEEGWTALPYRWNDEQTEAFYDAAGETRVITYRDLSGRKVTAPYVIPNKNQCKGCHLKDQSLVPIGPAARHLNRPFSYASEQENQLQHWAALGILKELPANHAAVPRLAVWDDPASGDLEARARAYLDINCGHCHSAQGPASTSGLFLTISEDNPARLGVNKSPVAAGRGAGNLTVDIDPGQPGNSILVFRMKTVDPAIAMPEIGREQIHKEGVELIEAWIRHMPVR